MSAVSRGRKHNNHHTQRADTTWVLLLLVKLSFIEDVLPSMSFKEDHERWQEAVGKILGVHQLTGEMALMDFNVVLDELNSLDYYSTRIIEDNEV